MADPEGREVRPAAGIASNTAATRTGSTASAGALGPGSEGERGEQIGAYQVLRLLGRGGMGDVFLAFDGRLKRHVAIKRCRADVLVRPRARERLRREAAAAARLSHPAVVQIYDILEEPSGEAIVMEYVDGHTLAQMVADRPLPVGRVVAIGRQVAEGLAAAQAMGLIHRDLKTENVRVTPTGQAKILDFGLAKHLSRDEESLTLDGAVVGTSRAMSPEQARGIALDARSDLFSLGVLLYEIGTGGSPFVGADADDTRRNVIAAQPRPARELNPALPAQLVELIDALLEKDPLRRPAGAAEVAEVLRAIEEDRLPRPRWFRGAAVGALALAAVLGFSLVRRGWAPERPLAVLVAEPRIASSPPDEPSRLAAFAIREAALATLAGLDRVEPLGPGELPEGGLSVADAARAVAADEVVVPAVDCQGQWCRVSLSRQRAHDARVVGNTGSFDVPSEPEDSLTLAKAVALHVLRAFSDHRPRSPTDLSEVKGADYPRYLTLRRRLEAGEVLGAREVDQLEEIARSSPGLVEASVSAAAVARVQSDRPRAERILRAAEARHQADPQLAYERFLLALELGEIADAETALAELERRAPGDVRGLRARARLLSRQGRLPEAAEVLRRMSSLRPSWKNLWYVADVEIDLADARGARLHLEQLVQVSPGNPRGLAKMAELEWLLGDPAEAARIYEGLLGQKTTAENLSNLGWSRMLAGQYSAASAAYARALELEPDDLLSRLNLGIAGEGGGEMEGARRVYRDVLERVARVEESRRLTVSELLIKAQALARLGDPVPAVTLTLQALGEGDRDVQVIFQAAVIYALCGDESNAIVHAKEARQRLSPRWFTVPGFESLRATPAFVELLAPA